MAGENLLLEVIPPCAGEMSAQPTKGARLREKKGDRRTAVDEVEKQVNLSRGLSFAKQKYTQQVYCENPMVF